MKLRIFKSIHRIQKRVAYKFSFTTHNKKNNMLCKGEKLYFTLDLDEKEFDAVKKFINELKFCSNKMLDVKSLEISRLGD